MELKFVNEGEKSFKIKKGKVFYKKQIEENEKVVGYIEALDFKKKKVDISGSIYLLSVMDKQLPLFDFYDGIKYSNKICGYLSVVSATGESCFVAIVSKKKWFKSLPLIMLLSSIKTASETIIAIAVVTTLMTGGIISIQNQFKSEPKAETKAKTKVEGEGKLGVKGDELVFGKTDKFNGTYINSNGDVVEKKTGQILKPLYLDISLKKGSPLQLINDPRNDAIIKYEMFYKGKMILSVPIKPGRSVNDWCPSTVLPVGVNNVTLLLSSYSLDGIKKDEVVSRNDFKITILN